MIRSDILRVLTAGRSTSQGLGYANAVLREVGFEKGLYRWRGFQWGVGEGF